MKILDFFFNQTEGRKLFIFCVSIIAMLQLFGFTLSSSYCGFLSEIFLLNFHISTYRIIVRFLRFNLNVGAEGRSIVRVIAAVDAATSGWVGVSVDVFVGDLTLLEVRRRRVFGVVLQHLDGDATVQFVLKFGKEFQYFRSIFVKALNLQ